MKALSIKQPYAHLILTGEKTVELRSWQTGYRGTFVLVSSKTPEKGYEKTDYPLGVALGIVMLKEIRKAEKMDARRAMVNFKVDGLYAWEVELVYQFTNPFPVVGKQGFYELDLPPSVVAEYRGEPVTKIINQTARRKTVLWIGGLITSLIGAAVAYLLLK